MGIKQLAAAFLALLGVIAPISPTKGLYVNDYASCLFEEHREAIPELAGGLAADAGIQVAAITVNSFDGLEAQAYADQVYQGWYNRGQIDGDAVLILLSTKEGRLLIAPYGSAAGAFVGTSLESIQGDMDQYLEQGAYSAAVMESFKQVALRLYAFAGIEPQGELADKLAAGTRTESQRAANFYYAVSIVLALLIVGRGFLVARKYHGKYAKRGFTRRKSYRAPPRPVFDDNEDKVDIVERGD